MTLTAILPLCIHVSECISKQDILILSQQGGQQRLQTLTMMCLVSVLLPKLSSVIKMSLNKKDSRLSVKLDIFGKCLYWLS